MIIDCFYDFELLFLKDFQNQFVGDILAICNFDFLVISSISGQKNIISNIMRVQGPSEADVNTRTRTHTFREKFFLYREIP